MDYIINGNKSLLDALVQLNILSPGTLVLFVVDDYGKMIGTLTDGDSRRALIRGASLNDKVENVMHRNFQYLTTENIADVKEIKRLRELKMKLIPVLDTAWHIVDVIDLDRY